MNFEFKWDEEKDAVNQMKHGVSFEDAALVFLDLNRIDIYDCVHSLSEDRWKTIGLFGCDILTVIYIMRDDTIRLISARKADKDEEEEYFYGYGEIKN